MLLSVKNILICGYWSHHAVSLNLSKFHFFLILSHCSPMCGNSGGNEICFRSKITFTKIDRFTRFWECHIFNGDMTSHTVKIMIYEALKPPFLKSTPKVLYHAVLAFDESIFLMIHFFLLIIIMMCHLYSIYKSYFTA